MTADLYSPSIAAAPSKDAGDTKKSHNSNTEGRLNLQQLMAFKETFQRALNGTLRIDEFLAAFETVLGFEDMTRLEAEHLFMKIDANSDGSVDWNEFSNYMLLENQAQASRRWLRARCCSQFAARCTHIVVECFADGNAGNGRFRRSRSMGWQARPQLSSPQRTDHLG